MGVAQVASEAKRLPEAVAFRGPGRVIGLNVDLQGVCLVNERMEFGTLQGQLDLPPPEGPRCCAIRRSITPLSDRDATLLRNAWSSRC